MCSLPADAISCHLQVFFTPLSQSLRLIIHLGEPLPEGTDFLFDFGALTCLFLFSFTLMMWTNGVGASTGMFVPALAVGAVGMCPVFTCALQLFLCIQPLFCAQLSMLSFVHHFACIA